MQKKFEPYHEAWLSAHPERSAEWLKAQLADGFDIHHLDGDHSNNDPDNLVLIECRDHMRLHGVDMCRVLRQGKAKRANPDAREHAAYNLKREGKKWREIQQELWGSGDKFTGGPIALYAAKRHAMRTGEPWPIT